MQKKAILVVLDGVGAGNAPDAAAYGDAGANTLLHTLEKASPALPNLASLGLFHMMDMPGKGPEKPIGSYGRLTEKSPGKDTTTGHWEMAGVLLDTPFPTFPEGFPVEIIDIISKKTGMNFIGNVAASGLEIIERYGQRHMETGELILYTSADSVFQVAAHEEILPPEALWRVCEQAREALFGPYAVGRVIARPFIGQPGKFTRTGNRRDFSLVPPSETMLDRLSANGFETIGIGKIGDIFAHRGLTQSDHASGNAACIASTLSMMERDMQGLIFTNLVDFDMHYGHRRDASGFAGALEEVDRAIPELLRLMGPHDLLIFTADHGCDPTFRGTDHTREQVPLLCYGKSFGAKSIGTRESFADISATILEFFGLKSLLHGKSFLSSL